MTQTEDPSLDQPRWIEWFDIDTIPLATRNAKDHDIGGLINSLHRFTVADLPVLDERTGRLVAGHGRVEALCRIRDGGGEPPNGVKVTADGRWTVPIVRGWASESDAAADAYAITSNRLTETGGWLDNILAEMLTDIASDTPALLAATGWDGDDLDRLLADSALADKPAPWDTEPGGVKDWDGEADWDGEGDSGGDAPSSFKSFDDETIDTDYRCPKCSYEWSGKPQ